MILGPSHVSIGVVDLDASLHFYRDLLGMTVTYDVPTTFSVGGRPPVHRRIAFVQASRGPGSTFHLALNEEPGRPKGPAPTMIGHGLNHFSLYLDDIHAIQRAVVDGGGIVLSPPALDVVDPWSVDGERRVLTALLADPDGTLVQVEQELSSGEWPAQGISRVSGGVDEPMK